MPPLPNGGGVLSSSSFFLSSPSVFVSSTFTSETDSFVLAVSVGWTITVFTGSTTGVYDFFFSSSYFYFLINSS